MDHNPMFKRRKGQKKTDSWLFKSFFKHLFQSYGLSYFYLSQSSPWLINILKNTVYAGYYWLQVAAYM